MPLKQEGYKLLLEDQVRKVVIRKVRCKLIVQVRRFAIPISKGKLMTNFLTSSKLQSCDFSFVFAGVFKLSKPFLEFEVVLKLFLPLIVVPKLVLHLAKVTEHCRMISDDVDAIARVQPNEC